MGGCRCTYRNCSVRSDGKTHLFHYPVFDKLRCHQWLTNAQRLDFLSLKVSQLKNRVVCQHHFTDEMFMNFLKDKLKCTAIPTELGPYCESQESDLIKFEIDLSPIKSEYIESEPLNISADKKAKFSIKYGDFLANCELMELDNIQPTKKVKVIRPFSSKPNKSILKEHYPKRVKLLKKVLQPIGIITKPNNNNCELQVAPQDKQENEFIYDNKPLGLLSEEQVNTNSDMQYLSQVDHYTISKKSNQANKCKITIISEENYTHPIPAIKSLIHVSPSAVLQPVEKTRSTDIVGDRSYNDQKISYVSSDPLDISVQNFNMPTMRQQNEEFVLEKTKSIVLPLEKEDFVLEKTKSTELPTKNYDFVLEKPNSTQLPIAKEDEEKDYCIRNQEENMHTQKIKRLSHNRIAAIEKKRKFNKKLRDIISDRLDKIDDPELEKIKPIAEPHPSNKNVLSHLASEPELPSIEHYIVKFLDARMKTMENTLLNRIDANSRNITELKASLRNEGSIPEKKKSFSVSTQTFFDEETSKKKLYNEISQYLSVEAKNKVFEDLFINKHFEPKRKVRSKKQS